MNYLFICLLMYNWLVSRFFTIKNSFTTWTFLHLSQVYMYVQECSPQSVTWKWKWKPLSHVQLFVTPWTIQSMEFSRPEYGVGSLSLFQGIFPTQGLNPGLSHCSQILYQLRHKGSPRTLEWVAYPFSSGSSWPRNQTRVSCMAGGFFTNWAIREA